MYWSFLFNFSVNLKLLLVVVFKNLASSKPFEDSLLTFGPRLTSSASYVVPLP